MSKKEDSNPFQPPSLSKEELANRKAEERARKVAEARLFKRLRVVIGLISALLLVVGFFAYTNQGADPFVTGLLIRVGSLLAVICLAFPELMSLRGRMSAVLYGIALILVVLIAVRPKLSRVLISLAVIGVGVGWVMKWMTKLTKEEPRRR